MIGTLINLIIGIIDSIFSFGKDIMRICNINKDVKYYLSNLYLFFIYLEKDTLNIIYELLIIIFLFNI